MDPQTTDADEANAISYHGKTGELFRIYLVNIALTILTLGIYRFWARTRIRDYLWSQTSFRGDRFEYTGVGKELFLGFLVVFVVIVAVSLAYQALYTVVALQWPDFEILLQLLALAATLVLIGVALYRARRYRLSRTRWRGIRGAQTGSALGFGLRRFGYILLTLLTLGFYWPFMNVRLLAFSLDNTWFGDRRFRFDGRGRDLLKPFAVVWLLFVPTLGLSWFFYRAAVLRYCANHTRYENLRFAAEVALRPLAMLLFTNMLLRLLTLGLAYPVVLVRSARFLCEHLRIVGDQDFAEIGQSLAAVPGRGEGLAAVLDVGEI
ncbi:MAG: YjgN family protein [Alphaproteobacteria bacterium]